MNRRRFLLASTGALVRTAWATAGDGVSWIRANRNGFVQETNWAASSMSAVGLGSLLKPFLAAAYLETHAAAPTLYCSHCWLPRGHGAQNLPNAIANSCNSYFLQLSADIDRAALDRVCLRFELATPDRAWPAERLIGLGQGWPQLPANAVFSFAALLRDRNSSKLQPIFRGMLRCASAGTARAIGLSCYAKTGTGLCRHHPSAAGDGYVVVIYPAAEPQTVLLVQQHGTTGAHAASAAQRLLS